MILAGVTLPDGLVWEDEFDWSPVSQNLTLTLTGTLLVQEAEALAGRPITLAGREDGCWASRAVVNQLYAMAQDADQVMSLTINGVTHQVVWRRDGQGPIEARQLLEVSNPTNSDFYVLKGLRFLKVG